MSFCNCNIVKIRNRKFLLPKRQEEELQPTESESLTDEALTSCSINPIIASCSTPTFSTDIPCPKTLQSLLFKHQQENYDKLCLLYSVTCSFSPSHIYITGTTSESLNEFAVKLRELIKKVSQNSPPTHFLALPLITNTLTKEQYTSFLSVLESSIKESAKFIPQQLVSAPSFHLTLSVLNLYTLEDVQQVNQILIENFDRLREMLPNPLVLRLGELAVMKGSIETCKVLHFEIQDDENKRKVEEFTVVVKNLLKNFIAPKNFKEKLRLHATVLNTKYGQHKKFSNVSVNVSSIMSFDSSVFSPIEIPCFMLYKMQKDRIFGYCVEKCFPINGENNEQMIARIKNC
ncbi:hypothetical protein RCL1_001143 [Eukaryota sp. TZLM3-RCL]